MAVLEVRNVKKVFGDNVILRGIDLDAVSYTHLTLPTILLV